MLANKTLTELLEAFSSPDPTPGGGSAAALTGALGASLLAMVAGMTKTKTGSPEERTTLDATRLELLKLRDTLVDLIDRDSAAYDAVVATYRKPKGTDEEKAARKAAIQAAMKLATDAPMETMRACADLVRHGEIVAKNGNPAATSDVGAGIAMAQTGLGGARLNVLLNLGSVDDDSYVVSVRREMDEILATMVQHLLPAYTALGWTGHEPPPIAPA